MTKINSEFKEKIAILTNQGFDGKQIAKKLNVSYQTIWRALKTLNVSPKKILEEKIIELASCGMNKKSIIKTLRIESKVIDDIFTKYRIPEKKITTINDLVSVRLFYFCNDIEMLAKRMAIEIFYQKPEKIIIPKRLQKIIKKEKISKVVNILQKINLSCNIEYAKA